MEPSDIRTSGYGCLLTAPGACLAIEWDLMGGMRPGRSAHDIPSIITFTVTSGNNITSG